MSTSIGGTYISTDAQMANAIVTASKLGTGTMALVTQKTGTGTSIDWSSIPTGYNRFQIIGWITPKAGGAATMRINNDSTALIYAEELTIADAANLSTSHFNDDKYTLQTTLINTLSNFIKIEIVNTASSYKMIISHCGTFDFDCISSGGYSNFTDAINRITLTLPNSDYNLGLYGAKA